MAELKFYTVFNCKGDKSKKTSFDVRTASILS